MRPDHGRWHRAETLPWPLGAKISPMRQRSCRADKVAGARVSACAMGRAEGAAPWWQPTTRPRSAGGATPGPASGLHTVHIHSDATLWATRRNPDHAVAQAPSTILIGMSPKHASAAGPATPRPRAARRVATKEIGFWHVRRRVPPVAQAGQWPGGPGPTPTPSQAPAGARACSRRRAAGRGGTRRRDAAPGPRLQPRARLPEDPRGTEKGCGPRNREQPRRKWRARARRTDRRKRLATSAGTLTAPTVRARWRTWRSRAGSMATSIPLWRQSARCSVSRAFEPAHADSAPRELTPASRAGSRNPASVGSRRAEGEEGEPAMRRGRRRSAAHSNCVRGVPAAPRLRAHVPLGAQRGGCNMCSTCALKIVPPASLRVRRRL